MSLRAPPTPSPRLSDRPRDRRQQQQRLLLTKPIDPSAWLSGPPEDYQLRHLLKPPRRSTGRLSRDESSVASSRSTSGTISRSVRRSGITLRQFGILVVAGIKNHVEHLKAMAPTLGKVQETPDTKGTGGNDPGGAAAAMDDESSDEEEACGPSNDEEAEDGEEVMDEDEVGDGAGRSGQSIPSRAAAQGTHEEK